MAMVGQPPAMADGSAADCGVGNTEWRTNKHQTNNVQMFIAIYLML